MTDFAEFEPSTWVEDGVYVIPLRKRASSGVRRLVKDVLLKTATTTAIALVASGSAIASTSIVASSSDFAITVPTSHSFASSEGADVDPRTWGRIVDRLRAMRTVEGERDFESEPEPFV